MTSVTLIYKDKTSERFTEVIKFALAVVQTKNPDGSDSKPIPSFLIGKQNGLTVLRSVEEVGLFFVD
jgi:hypothetical protein